MRTIAPQPPYLFTVYFDSRKPLSADSKLLKSTLNRQISFNYSRQNVQESFRHSINDIKSCLLSKSSCFAHGTGVFWNGGLLEWGTIAAVNAKKS